MCACYLVLLIDDNLRMFPRHLEQIDANITIIRPADIIRAFFRHTTRWNILISVPLPLLYRTG